MGNFKVHYFASSGTDLESSTLTTRNCSHELVWLVRHKHKLGRMCFLGTEIGLSRNIHRDKLPVEQLWCEALHNFTSARALIVISNMDTEIRHHSCCSLVKMVKPAQSLSEMNTQRVKRNAIAR